VAPRSRPLDAFWLPASMRPLVEDLPWEVHHVVAGQPVAPGDGVAVRWPVLGREEMATLLGQLRAACDQAEPDLVERWQRALQAVPGILMEQPEMLEAIACYTGYPGSMMMLAFAQGDLMQFDVLGRALGDGPSWAAARAWQPMPAGLPGMVRFFPARRSARCLTWTRGRAPLFRPLPPAQLAIGFAAGNVPGNGLLIALQLHVANHTALGVRAASPPAVLVRNSRQAPLLAPWVLSAVEQIDPKLVAGLAMLVFDYDDAALRRALLGEADLVMAAASDQTIAAIDAHLEGARSPARFHRHGHKVSFSVVGREALGGDLGLPAGLAALDSTFWDQLGCLSARVHFVEQGGKHSPADYAAALSDAMRRFARQLPRGVAPARSLHRAFDTYKLLENGNSVRVLTSYDDDALVVLDQRSWNTHQWRDTVNRCTGRVVVVRPVEDVAEVFTCYLRGLPPENLQSLSVAVSSERALELAEGAGRRGVTALRSLGRAAFPKMAYSWDGLLPLDLGNVRPPGYFTTLETDDPLAGMAEAAAQLALLA